MCGVFGGYSFIGENLAPLVPGAVMDLQNRGRDSVGAGGGDSSMIYSPNRFWKESGSAQVWFEDPTKADAIMAGLAGNVVGGHVRYATSSKRNQREAQPGYADWLGNMLLIFSNGDIPFCAEERKKLEKLGCKFATMGDSEVIAKMIAMRLYRNNMADMEAYMRAEEKAFVRVGKSLQGTFSLVSLTPSKRLFAMRDPLGNHPLWKAETDNDIFFCSESAVLEELGERTGRVYHTIEPVKPGTLITVSQDKRVQTIEFGQNMRRAACMMEYFYFARPDSFAEHAPGKRFGQIRRQFGIQLAKEWKGKNYPKPDYVTSVPESGNSAGEGCATELGVPYFSLIMKNRFTPKRNFQGQEKDRERSIRSKLKIDGDVKGKIILVIDDSIVRGQQSREAVRKLYKAGTKAVYFASTAPPFISGCYYGINVSNPNNLIAYKRTEEEVRQEIGVEYLLYLSVEGALKVIGVDKSEMCTACFTKEYPIPVPNSLPEA